MESRLSPAENCTFCSKLLESDSLTVTEDVLDLFEFLVESVDRVALQNGLICSACLEKIKEAVNFKTLYLAKQENSNVEIKQEPVSDEKSIICYICKTATEQNSFMSLFNTCYENVATYMIQKEDLICLSPQICDTCHLSALNFQSMTQFLSVCNKRNNDLLKSETVTDENEFKMDIVYNCFPTDSILNLDRTNQLKQEIKKIKESEEDFQKKPAELDLKETCEARPSGAGFWSLNYEDEERSSILPRPENLNVTNDSYLTTNIAKIEMDYKESSNSLINEKHDNINDKFDELEIFKCSECKFQAEHTNELYKHAIIHKNLDEVETLQCHNCYLQMKKYRSLLDRHAIKHKNINHLKMFRCHNCEVSLKQNILTRKNIFDLRTFKCYKCDFQTKYKNYIKEHILTHKKTFKCPNCEFRAITKISLTRHMVTHKYINSHPDMVRKT